ncbi:MAG: YibE/F family protein [Patescibacteria group bacterium]|nr:YibE/F family protein [Patescibacteria group bacterium]
MRKTLLVLGVMIVLGGLGASRARAVERDIYAARVIKVEDVIEQEGLKTQEVQVEILEGDNKGNTTKLVIPYDELFIRQLRVGDKVKITASSIDGEEYYQFFDFVRTRNYIWLFVLFLVLTVAFLGLKGMKTLLPSILLVLGLIVGMIPFSGHLVQSVVLCLIIIAAVSSVTAWVRAGNKLLVFAVSFSVILSLVVGLFVFLGFSQASYIVPFIGSITTLDESLYDDIIIVIILSILFIPAGGVINASIQVAKHIWEEFSDKARTPIGEMLKQGLKVSQKISSGELNNIIIAILGLSLAGIFLVKEQYPEIAFWDNGWVALQVVYTISSGIAILLITPITVLSSAAFLDLIKHKSKVVGGQRRLNVTVEKNKRR